MTDQKPYYHEKSVQIPLYSGIFGLIISNDLNRIQKRIPEFEENGPEIFANACLCDWDGWQGFVMVLNYKNTFKKLDMGAIAHEAYHLANFIANERGIGLDYENDEPQAYLLTWIINQTFIFIKESGIKNILEFKYS